ncbi:MAG: hypothetical protein GPJ54_12745 [Candidatus Heimdallarchaeota archaeon]|nr:hypothetical protein [Candidatus Heimdallarchaeota archaeon]
MKIENRENLDPSQRLNYDLSIGKFKKYIRKLVKNGDFYISFELKKDLYPQFIDEYNGILSVNISFLGPLNPYYKVFVGIVKI